MGVSAVGLSPTAFDVMSETAYNGRARLIGDGSCAHTQNLNNIREKSNAEI